MSALAGVRPSFAPPVPQSQEELHLSESMVLDLVLRRLLLDGFSTLQSLSKSLRLSIPIIDKAFRHLRGQQLLEVKGMIGNDYQFVLSQAGKDLATPGELVRPVFPLNQLATQYTTAGQSSKAPC